jgi:hypothetical protein
LELEDELLELEEEVLELDEEQGGRPWGFAPFPFQHPGSASGIELDPALALPAKLKAIAKTRQIVPV